MHVKMKLAQTAEYVRTFVRRMCQTQSHTFVTLISFLNPDKNRDRLTTIQTFLTSFL